MKALDQIERAVDLLREDLVHAEPSSDLERSILLAHFIKFKEEPSGLDGVAQKLLEAAQQTLLHLQTTMDLPNYPESCLCYGCNLNRAVFDYVFEKARQNVAPIVKSEIDAENRTRGFKLGGR